LINLNTINPSLILNYDLAVKYKNVRLITDSNIYLLLFAIQNLGTKSASDFDLLLYLDRNGDSIINNGDELIWNENIRDSLKSKDSLVREIRWNNKIPGYQQLIFYIDFKLDTKLSNNFICFNIFNSYPPQSIVINEIMFNPFPNQSEYVELYNNSDYKINLINWKISDQRLPGGSRNEYKIVKEIFIEPKGYLTLSSDTLLFKLFPYLQESKYFFYSFNKSSLNLNNDEDDVILSDFNSNIIDSVRYFAAWHNPNVDDPTGISLERINPQINSNYKDNWNSCVLKIGGTPGKPNSILIQSRKEYSKIEISPNPFSPDMDGFEDYTIIRYNINQKFAKIRARIFDDHGRLIRTLINNEYSSSSGEIIWDGLDDSKGKLRIGIYILLLEALDDSNGLVETYKGVIVLAKKL
jgi:hypothetical protein